MQMQKLKDFLGSKEEIRARSGSYDSKKCGGSKNVTSTKRSKSGEGRVWSCTDSRGFLTLPSGTSGGEGSLSVNFKAWKQTSYTIGYLIPLDPVVYALCW